MSKLLRIDRKLRTLSRRLTTDANGAPCCCQTSDQCPCNPALPFGPFPYVTCVGGRYRDSQGNVIIAASPSARMVVLRAQWQIQDRNFQDSGSAGGYRVITDQIRRHQGQAQWCLVRSSLINQWSATQAILNNASSAYEIQLVGNRIEPISFAENYVGNEALGYYNLVKRGSEYVRVSSSRALVGPIAANNGLGPTYAFAGARGIVVDASPFGGGGGLEPQASGDGTSCDFTGSFTRTRSYGTLTQSRRFVFASNATQAAWTDTVNVVDPFFDGGTRYSWSIAVVYTVRYLTCTTSGDPTGSLVGEPGCSNCFDPSKLEPM